MGCGRSKGSVKSTSPSENRRRVDSGVEDREGENVASTVRAKNECSGVRNFPPPVLPEGLTRSQQEFFRDLDERIDQGEELDNEALERENLSRMQQLMHEWHEVVQSRPVTARNLTGRRRSSPAARLAGCRMNGGVVEGAAGVEEAGRQERSGRSSRRATRAGSFSLAVEGTRVPVDCVDDAAGVSVSKLLQLGDAYVRDLDAGDPDGFVRLGRRPSVYEEVAIPEEAGDLPQSGKLLSIPTTRAVP